MNRRRVRMLSWWALWASIIFMASSGEGGRPFRTEDNATVPRGNLDIELATDLAFEKADRDIVFPVWALKAGITDWAEVGAEGGYEFARTAGVDEVGLTDTTLKIKARFYDGVGGIPSFATTVGLILPTADRALSPSRKLGFLGLAQASADLQAATYFANLGVTLTEDPEEPHNRLDADLLWGIAWEIPIRADVALAVDFFGQTQQDAGIAQSGLLGVIWRSPWQIDFDMAVIVGLTPSADDVGLTLGLTYHVPIFGAAPDRQARRGPGVQARRARPLRGAGMEQAWVMLEQRRPREP